MKEPVSIMIVEDEPLTRETLCTIIKEQMEEQFNLIIPVANGLEAMEKLDQIHCNILLTDISMPEMDGIKLIEKVDEKYSDIIKIIITGYNDFNYAQSSIKYHVLDYLLKPVASKELINALMRGVEEEKRIRKEKRNASLIDMHNSGKLSFLYTSNYIKKLIVAIKARNENAIREISNNLSQYLIEQCKNFFEQQQMAYWIVCTFFSCCPELLFGQIDMVCKSQIGKSKNIEEISDILKHLFLQCSNHLCEISSSQKKLNQIKEYISSHYNEEISLQVLADKFELNPTYICDLFKMVSKQNYMDFLQEIRIDKAVSLLENSDLKISQIAEAIGYNDANYFAKAFKRIVGMTPNEFRSKVKGGYQ